MRFLSLILVLAAVAASLLAGASTALGADATDPPGYLFSDDDGSVHEGAIEAVAAAGITRGCGERLFCPDEELSRGQFAALLDRALGLAGTSRDFFADDDGTEHEGAANRLVAAGIAAGCGARRFCPEELVTRAQAAALLARALPGLEPADHDYFSDDDGSVHEDYINALAHNGIAEGCKPDRFCPQDPVRRGLAASLLARALGLATAPPNPTPWRLELVVDGIEGGTTDLQAPAGDDRLFLTTRAGLVRIIEDGAFLPEPFLDITALVRTEGSSERGLLGLAFHPYYSANRRFFVFYSDSDGHSQVYEYRADPDDPNRADPSTARQIITFEQRPTAPTHKGGQLQFGPDGYLYAAVGDGGGKGDPFDHGQNPHTELGAIVRIDVDSGYPYAVPADNPFADGTEGLPEVWAYGLRNPWRFSFDGSQVYIADVGHLTREEVNVTDASAGGINYGWNLMEGADCHSSAPDCDRSGLFIPQIDYGRQEGVSVIGGYVYRGDAVPEIDGWYFYADFTGAWIRTFLYDDGEVTQHYDWSLAIEIPRIIWSFGKDGHGELYVLARWSVYKIVPAGGAEEAPVEEVSAEEEAPVEEAPVEEAPVEEAPVEEVSVMEEAPAEEEAPVEEVSEGAASP